jgi:hypothetical protein
MSSIAIPDVRATPEELRAWGRAAAVSRLELAAWIVKALNEAALGRGRGEPVVEVKNCAQCGKALPPGRGKFCPRPAPCGDRAYRARRRAAG